MSTVIGKHAYRFVYLKSEEWKNVRVEALAREHAKCEICGVEDISNDAHHVYYPKSFWETTVDHLVILCRPCHNVAHALIKNGKKTPGESISEWKAIIKALQVWRSEKAQWIEDPDAIMAAGPKDLRLAYEKLRDRNELLEMKISMEAKNPPLVKIVEISSNALIDPDKMAPKQLRQAYHSIRRELDLLKKENSVIHEHYGEVCQELAKNEMRKSAFRFCI